MYYNKCTLHRIDNQGIMGAERPPFKYL